MRLAPGFIRVSCLRRALKGRQTIAQGNALCMKIFKHVRALKERKKRVPITRDEIHPTLINKFYTDEIAVAPSGLSKISGHFFTGRCPVLLLFAPLGLLHDFNKRSGSEKNITF